MLNLQIFLAFAFSHYIYSYYLKKIVNYKKMFEFILNLLRKETPEPGTPSKGKCRKDLLNRHQNSFASLQYNTLC
ncbi:hypothetical protein JO40_05470 [Treponema putidum]|nr:hypothetical protein JO40_05470 [Treponema putidum]